MLASFHSDGTTPEEKLLLARSHRDGLMLAAQFFSSNAGMESEPVALFSSSLLIARLTSSTVSGMSEMVDRFLASSSKAKGKKFSLTASV